MTTDERYMHRCLQLARMGELEAAPNPMVGAVLVADGTVIGEGFHRRCGEAHAEVNAFASVRRPDLLSRARLYVSLEPCAHFGRTPPCAQLIVEKGVPEVVVGMTDPFARVNGEGIRILQAAGIHVTTGVLESECRELNRKFVTFHTLHRPYITLKWAQSSDGFMAPPEQRGRRFVSTSLTELRVHHLRATHQAILVGRRTAMLDNPSLTLRRWSGRSPLRIVLDRDGCLPATLRIFDGTTNTLVVGRTDPATRRSAGTYTFLHSEEENLLPPLLSYLHAESIQSLLVEGGRALLQSFIDQNLWDELHIEVGTEAFGSGVAAPTLPTSLSVAEEPLWGHTILHCRNRLR